MSPVPESAPDGLKRLHRSVYNRCREGDGNSEEKCSQIAWGAVKRIYKLSPEGVWVVKKNQNERFVIKLGEPKEWVTLMPFGNWVSRGIEVTQKLAQKIADNFKKNVLDYPPPINVDHDDKMGSRGHIADVRVGEGGLEVKPEFTAKAAQEIAEDMWPYISAELDTDYEHKESGEKVGPSLLGMGLVLRPYLGSRAALYNEGTGEYESFDEHMKPEIQGVVEAVNALVRAYNGKDEEDGGEKEEELGEVLRLFDSYLLEKFLPAYEYAKSEIEWQEQRGSDDMTPSQARMLPLYRAAVGPLKAIVDEAVKDLSEEEMGEVLGLAEWDARYVNDLPDSAFLYVAPGGEKDDEGRTKPRTLRKLPYRNAAGDVDLPHLRNALSRLPQTDLPADVRQTLIKKAQALLTRETEQSEPAFELDLLFGNWSRIEDSTSLDWDELESIKTLRETVPTKEQLGALIRHLKEAMNG